MKYVIGIDGGGTKTLGVLFDSNGVEVNRVLKGFSNFSVDTIKSISNIFDCIHELIRDIDSLDILCIQLGIAGYTNFEGKEHLISKLKQEFQTKVYITTDAEIAYYSVKQNYKQTAIMVLGGTGSVVTLEKNNETKMIGGFGHILGDEGSAYHLSIQALKNVIKQFEEQQKITVLSSEILNHLNLKDYNEIKNYVYNREKREIAKLSKFIAKLAKEGNQEAKMLFVDEGVSLAKQTINAYNHIDTLDEVVLGLRGGFLLEAPFVKETMIYVLDKEDVNYKLDEKYLEPVQGAYYLALKHLNSEEVA